MLFFVLVSVFSWHDKQEFNKTFRGSLYWDPLKDWIESGCQERKENVNKSKSKIFIHCLGSDERIIDVTLQKLYPFFHLFETIYKFNNVIHFQFSHIKLYVETSNFQPENLQVCKLKISMWKNSSLYLYKFLIREA